MILVNIKYNNNEFKKDRILFLLVDVVEGDYIYVYDLNILKVYGKIDYWMYICLLWVCDLF